MRVLEKSTRDIQEKLATMSDFLKIDYLESALKSNIDIEAKKFCHLKLAELYEQKKMFAEAAKNMLVLASFAITFKDQINSFMKETELWIKALRYEKADDSFKKALIAGNATQKQEMKNQIYQTYLSQAKMFEQTQRNSHAAKAYEKLLELTDEEKRSLIKDKLFALYTRLGKIREAKMLRQSSTKQTQSTSGRPVREKIQETSKKPSRDDADSLINSL